MSGFESGRANGLPDGVASGGTTLDELLDDESFGYSPNSVALENGYITKYNDCLTTFVAGDADRCLQKLYEYGLLTSESLQNNDKTSSLFQEACYATGNFSHLGFRLQDIIRQYFTGDLQSLHRQLAGCSLANEISVSNKYYRCCAYALLLTQPVVHEKAIELEDATRRTIAKYSSNVNEQDEASEIEQLVGTHIFHIQIKLLQRVPSTTLYKKLVARIPNLSDLLQNWPSSYRDETIESHILSQLELKHSKVKKQHQRHRNNSVAAPEPTVPTAKDVIPTTSKKSELRKAPRWVLLWRNYFSRIDLSRQSLFFLLFFLLLSLKSTKKWTKFPKILGQASRSLFLQLKGVLSLLGSI